MIFSREKNNSLILWLGSQFQIRGVRDKPTCQLYTSITADAPKQGLLGQIHLNYCSFLVCHGKCELKNKWILTIAEEGLYSLLQGVLVLDFPSSQHSLGSPH